jgi:hypothetical protein
VNANSVNIHSSTYLIFFCSVIVIKFDSAKSFALQFFKHSNS